MNGYFKLYRKLLKDDMYKALNSKQRDVFFVCLMLANYTTNKWEFNGKIFECQPGQFITSLSSLEKNCANDVKTKSVRTALLKLEKWGFLTNESTKTGRLITICNWDIYQSDEDDEDKDIGKEVAKRWQRGGKEVATNNKVKKVKKEKKEKKEREETRTEIEIQFGPFYKKLTPFYQAQISENDDSAYWSFVRFIFGDNEGQEVLRMARWKGGQISFKWFQKLMEISGDGGDELSKVCMDMHMKNYEYHSFFLSVKKWLIDNLKRKQ